jgi:periplasmic protein TonB
MKPELILQADILDIIFENRNKDYGAYLLRKDYNRRMKMAMSGVLLLVALIFITGYWKRPDHKFHSGLIGKVDTVILTPPPRIEPPPTEPPKQKIATVRNPSFVLTAEPTADTLPTIDDLDKDVRIGLKTVDGTPAVSDAPPPEQPNENHNYSVSETPKQKVEILDHAEIMPEFPGGYAAFSRFLSKNLRMPEDALQPGQKIKILVRFVVGKEGELSNIQFMEAYGEVFEHEVLRVMKKMPKWRPGQQNGEFVQVYFKLPIVFDWPDE